MALNRSLMKPDEYVTTETVMARHRREMLMQVYLPIGGVAFLIVAVSLVILFGLSREQVGTISAFMSLLMLVPTVLVCLIPYVLLIAMGWGVRRLVGWLPERIHSTRRVVRVANESSYLVAHRVVNPLIAISQRLAWLERFFGFEPPHAD